MRGTEVKTHKGELPLDHGHDLDELEPEGLTGGLSEHGSGDRETANRFEGV
jgi:hypothetical protein